MNNINVREHFGLVGLIVSRLVQLQPGQLMEETEEWGDGMVGLARAKNEFKPELGNKFCTFAYWCIRSEVLRGRAYRARHYTPALSLDAELSNELTLHDMLSAPENTTEQVDAKDLINVVFRRIPRNMANVLQLRFMQHITLKEIGDELGICKERVRQIEQDGLSKAYKVVCKS